MKTTLRWLLTSRLGLNLKSILEANFSYNICYKYILHNIKYIWNLYFMSCMKHKHIISLIISWEEQFVKKILFYIY